MTVRVLMVDDHVIVRQGLCSLVNNEDGMEVVGEAAEGRTAIKLARELKPDVIVIDVSMPGMDGVEATRRINRDTPSIKIIALSMYSKKSFILEMLKAGALGYILKDAAFDELIKAINTVIHSKKYLCPKATNIILEDYVLSPSGHTCADKLLTGREIEILKLLADGKPSKEIALLLNLSIKTVDACRRRIMRKLGVQSIAELVKYAIRESLTFLDI
ncbi:MAG: response regulator transcription factor [Sedimentisphaerales bacterium]|nr:response regulator transcription factor [Sedimentisphaerales bacterium]